MWSRVESSVCGGRVDVNVKCYMTISCVWFVVLVVIALRSTLRSRSDQVLRPAKCVHFQFQFSSQHSTHKRNQWNDSPPNPIGLRLPHTASWAIYGRNHIVYAVGEKKLAQPRLSFYFVWHCLVCLTSFDLRRNTINTSVLTNSFRNNWFFFSV